MRGRDVILGFGLTPMAAGPGAAQPRPSWPPEGRGLIRGFSAQDGFSELARRMGGERASAPGFMAPPLKADADVFVPTHAPMATCPFCDGAAEWPESILMVRLTRPQPRVDHTRRILVPGALDLGEERDPETGFVSPPRLVDARCEDV